MTDGPRARLDVVESADGAPLLVRLGGELDLAGAADIGPDLDDLLRRDAQPLRIDATELTFADSSGVAVLLRIADHFSPVEIVHATSVVRRVVEVLGLAARLGLREEA
ncbi:MULTISPECIES: STAS domain-containing protein [unclassified Geodermatophilus]|uniref:STAS domain-containing protein n=1 Tax=unclassified Geodermatophilus TaxID=2637632 RepID=UPI003EEC3814